MIVPGSESESFRGTVADSHRLDSNSLESPRVFDAAFAALSLKFLLEQATQHRIDLVLFINSVYPVLDGDEENTITLDERTLFAEIHVLCSTYLLIMMSLNIS